jgi:hypothetical protein
MVKYYAERLVPGKVNLNILERTLLIFLTILGKAIARKKTILVKVTDNHLKRDKAEFC